MGSCSGTSVTMVASVWRAWLGWVCILIPLSSTSQKYRLPRNRHIAQFCFAFITKLVSTVIRVLPSRIALAMHLNARLFLLKNKFHWFAETKRHDASMNRYSRPTLQHLHIHCPTVCCKIGVMSKSFIFSCRCSTYRYITIPQLITNYISLVL